MNPDSSVGQLIQRYDHDPYDHDTFFATSCRLQTHEDFGKFPAISGLHPLLRYHIHVDTKYCAKDSCTNIQNITCHDLLTYVQCICMYICICAYIYIYYFIIYTYIYTFAHFQLTLFQIQMSPFSIPLFCIFSRCWGSVKLVEKHQVAQQPRSVGEGIRIGQVVFGDLKLLKG